MGFRTQIFNAMQRIAYPRQRRAYAGAMRSRLTDSWASSGSSADTEIKGSIRQLRNRSRQLVRDNDYAKQACRSVVNNVVGAHGIRMQSQVRMARGGGRMDTAINDRIEMAWRLWGRKDSCDVAGVLCWIDFQRMAMQAIAESGEVFIRLLPVSSGSSAVPFSLQIVEADLIDEQYTGPTTNGNSYWRMGIEHDSQTHRPLNYAFLREHPGDTATLYSTEGREHTIISARDVIHLFIPTRPNQTRGVPMLASSLERLHHVGAMEKAEVIRSRAASCLMGFIQTPDGELFGDGVQDGERVQNWEPGSWHYLAPGESVQVPQIDSPDNQYEPFLRAQLQGVAAGMGTDYSSVSGDYSRTNYSSSRLALIETRAHWQSLQYFLIENLCQVVYERWLEMAVLSNAIPLNNFEIDRPRYMFPHWIPRAWPWIDPQKEVASYKEAIMCGFKTHAEVVQEQGGDLEELMLQRQREVERAEELGLQFAVNEVNNVGAEEQPTANQNGTVQADEGGEPDGQQTADD